VAMGDEDDRMYGPYEGPYNDSYFDNDESSPPYSICYNESVTNFTSYSIYCNNSYIIPNYGESVSNFLL